MLEGNVLIFKIMFKPLDDVDNNNAEKQENIPNPEVMSRNHRNAFQPLVIF